MKSGKSLDCPTIVSGSTRALFYQIVSAGIPPEKLEELTGINRSNLEDPDYRIPVEDHVKLWPVAVQYTGDPALGLHIAEQDRLSDLGVVGHLMSNAGNLKIAVRLMITYLRLLVEDELLVLQEKEDSFLLDYEINQFQFYTRHAVERMIASIVIQSRILTGKDIVPLKIDFTHKKPEYFEEYQRIFKAPVYFDRQINRIEFKRSDFELQLPGSQSYLQGVLEGHAATLLQKLKQEETLKGKVLRLILKLLPMVDSTQVAEKLGMSGRTLNRKLKEEKTSFREIYEEARKNLATDYLKKGEFSICDVAFMTGFSQTSAFNRAFKRWTGQNPGVFRKQISPVMLSKTP